MSADRPASVCILGGGTAGWMAACLFQQAWGPTGTEVRLIESRDIPTVGVGEGSTPQLKAFFDRLGIDEADWMPRCEATYKVGIEFRGWSGKPGYESYFHPFPTDLDIHTVGDFFQQAWIRRRGGDVPAHPDRYMLPVRLADERRRPHADPAFPFAASYGYHFDAGLMGAYLRDVATARGVVHEDARIAEVERAPNGDLAALLAEDGRRFVAELFVDASGFAAMLMSGALGVPHHSFADNLFNDRAVVAPTPREPGPIRPCTTSHALSAGWAWHIPLTSRSGNGYVYSSRYLDEDSAAAELRAHLGLPQDAAVRHLSMRVGRLERSWERNALAVGLAQGFVEPLEATALHVVLATIELFIDKIDRHGSGPAPRQAFNRAIGDRLEGIRDYIVAHYRAAPRQDTPYWRDATSHDHLSDSLKALFTCWFTGQDLAAEVERQGIATYYNATSWHCLFAGYGNFPPVAGPPPPEIRTADMARVEHFLAACASHFPPDPETA